VAAGSSAASAGASATGASAAGSAGGAAPSVEATSARPPRRRRLRAAFTLVGASITRHDAPVLDRFSAASTRSHSSTACAARSANPQH
jgi:hypothetical protein